MYDCLVLGRMVAIDLLRQPWADPDHPLADLSHTWLLESTVEIHRLKSTYKLCHHLWHLLHLPAVTSPSAYSFVCLQPINHLSGQSTVHSTLAVLYAIINLKPSLRMSIPALQIATICRDADAKLVGMNEIINGGSTSVGAQLRKFRVPCPPVKVHYSPPPSLY